MTMLLLAGLFLPLFPFSLVFGFVLARLPHPLLRALLLLLWPHAGIGLLQAADMRVPEWFVPWAVATAAFYALRLLTARDLDRWAGMLAVSAYVLIWGLAAGGVTEPTTLHAFAFWFSLPAALLSLLAGSLAQRLGAAYAGLQGGLGSVLPRLSTLLVLAVLAAVATPPFPGFFGLIALLQALGPALAIAVLLIWLSWGWSATRLLQGFVFGPERAGALADLPRGTALLWGGALLTFTLFGLYLSGSMA